MIVNIPTQTKSEKDLQTTYDLLRRGAYKRIEAISCLCDVMHARSTLT